MAAKEKVHPKKMAGENIKGYGFFYSAPTGPQHIRHWRIAINIRPLQGRNT